MAKLALSVVVVAPERADSLERLLSSLGQLRYDRFEIVVVHGPAAAAAVAAPRAGVRVFAAGAANIAAARNLGVAQARGEVVAFIDGEAVAEPDWLERLVQPYVHPDVVAVGGAARIGAGAVARPTVCDRFGEPRAETGGDETFLCFAAANFSVRRETLAAVGGFDETYARDFDVADLCLRLQDAGMKCVAAPDAEVRCDVAAPRPRQRERAYFCVRRNLGRKRLGGVLAHLAEIAARESDATPLAEIERGVTEALRREAEDVAEAEASAPRAAAGPFAAFPLRLAADKRLRVCLFSREYPPQGYGGIGQWTREVATGLAARGHEVTVISRALDGRPSVDFVEGVFVHRIDAAPITPRQAQAFAPAPASLTAHSLALLAEVERIDARRRFDLISGPIADLDPMASLALASVPVIVSLHTTYKLSLPHKPDWLSRPDYLKGHVEPAIACESRLIAEGPHILANSRVIVADIEAAHGLTIDRAKTAIIPHGVSDLARGAAVRSRDDGAVHLLFVGRLEERKGADVLLAILPDLLAAHPALIAHIVGDDGIAAGDKTLRRRFEDDNAGRPDVRARTKFYGALPRAEVEAHYAAADIFVAPSKYESFGLIFIEAMCFGKPVVAYDVGGAAEIVTNEVDGLLAPADAPQKLAAAIARLVENPRLREDLGRNARRTYESAYTTELMIDRLEAYYRQVREARPLEAARLRA